MKLVFNKIKYQNIMSVGNTPIEIDFTQAKKTLITGKNGGGKSTLIEALTYALFGKPFRDLKVGQLVNSVNKKKSIVELWLSYGNDSFYIKRGQKGKLFEVWKNDEKLPEDAASGDYQDQLEQMINMNLVSFKQVIVLGTAGYVPFMNLKTPERRKLVEDLLSLSVISVMDKLNKSYLRGASQNLETLNMQHQHIMNELATHQRFIDQQRRMIEQQKAMVAERKLLIQKQKEKASENLQQYEDIYNSHLETAKGIKAKMIEIQQQIVDTVINGDDQTENLAKLRDGLTRMNMQVEQFNKLKVMYEKGGECPACQQVIAPTPERMQEIVKKLEAGTQKIVLIKNKQTELQAIMNEMTRQQQELRSLKTKHDTMKGTLQNEVANAKRVRAQIDNRQPEAPIEELVVEEIVIDESPIAELNGKADDLNGQRTGLVKEKYIRSIITDMLKDSGVKATIVKRYIPYFNKQIAFYLDLLGADYAFTLDDEFNETIKSFGRDDFSYTSFSEGEKARINLALLFTWRDVTSKVSGVDLSLLVLDEVFDGALDADGSSAIKTLLDGIDGNTIVISHRDLDTQDFDRHIMMQKVGRFTAMVEK